MASLYDYLDQRGNRSFSELPFNEIDGLILSQICYVPFDGILSPDPAIRMTLREAVAEYVKRHTGKYLYLGRLIPSEIVVLAAKAAKTPRFSSVLTLAYTNHLNLSRQMQFCAMTFLFGEQAFVAYRGTDDSLVGWKENFNMSFMDRVPAQEEAVLYLEALAPYLPERINLGGHSKGGNLAIYAAVHASEETKKKIGLVYNYDGPGFRSETLQNPEFRRMKSKIRTFLPQSSVVGMLLEHEGEYTVIKSNGKALMQHDAITWEVRGSSFVRLKSVTKGSRLIDRSLKQWLQGLSEKDREEVADSLYTALSKTRAKSLTELTAKKGSLVQAWKDLPPKTRQILFRCVKIFLQTAKQSRVKR